jgi:hypothetical protein
MCVSEAMQRRKAVPQYRCAYTRRLAFLADTRTRLSEFFSIGRIDATYTEACSYLRLRPIKLWVYCYNLVTRIVQPILAGNTENASS